MKLSKIIIAICSLLFIMIGIDKFILFLEPPCTLMSSTPPIIWKLIGILQIVAGVLIWLPSLRKYVAGFFIAFMTVFMSIHLIAQTYDIGGAFFMVILLSLLVWNPDLLGRKISI